MNTITLPLRENTLHIEGWESPERRDVILQKLSARYELFQVRVDGVLDGEGKFPVTSRCLDMPELNRRILSICYHGPASLYAMLDRAESAEESNQALLIRLCITENDSRKEAEKLRIAKVPWTDLAGKEYIILRLLLYATAQAEEKERRFACLAGMRVYLHDTSWMDKKDLRGFELTKYKIDTACRLIITTAGMTRGKPFDSRAVYRVDPVTYHIKRVFDLKSVSDSDPYIFYQKNSRKHSHASQTYYGVFKTGQHKSTRMDGVPMLLESMNQLLAGISRVTFMKADYTRREYNKTTKEAITAALIRLTDGIMPRVTFVNRTEMEDDAFRQMINLSMQVLYDAKGLSSEHHFKYTFAPECDGNIPCIVLEHSHEFYEDIGWEDPYQHDTGIIQHATVDDPEGTGILTEVELIVDEANGICRKKKKHETEELQEKAAKYHIIAPSVMTALLFNTAIKQDVVNAKADTIRWREKNTTGEYGFFVSLRVPEEDEDEEQEASAKNRRRKKTDAFAMVIMEPDGSMRFSRVTDDWLLFTSSPMYRTMYQQIAGKENHLVDCVFYTPDGVLGTITRTGSRIIPPQEKAVQTMNYAAETHTRTTLRGTKPEFEGTEWETRNPRLEFFGPVTEMNYRINDDGSILYFTGIHEKGIQNSVQNAPCIRKVEFLDGHAPQNLTDFIENVLPSTGDVMIRNGESSVLPAAVKYGREYLKMCEKVTK